jgi:hypothetical protein
MKLGYQDLKIVVGEAELTRRYRTSLELSDDCKG